MLKIKLRIFYDNKIARVFAKTILVISRLHYIHTRALLPQIIDTNYT